MASPFLKWAGGKAKLAPKIAERAPASFGTYHEPFLGGGAAFFRIAAERDLAAAALSDLNAELIATYATIRDSVDDVIAALEPHARRYSRLSHEARAAYYYEVRARHPRGQSRKAARLIFLNRTCYNGLYRVNRKGQFNVPHGRYVEPRILNQPLLRACSEALHRANLHSASFETACAAAQPGDFVYLDPPYFPLSPTAQFTAYTRGSFGPADQERLRDTFDDLTRRGVAAILSNSCHPYIHGLYDGRGYALEEVPMSRAINSAPGGRKPIPELLVSNLCHPAVRAAFPPGSLPGVCQPT